jgi:hypothetical protein
MRRIHKVLLIIAVVFIAAQFIQPTRNKSGQVSPTAFEKVYSVPANVHSILQGACYDCHSNNTFYPWYANIQPVAAILAKHIKDGKEELNFSEFGNYTNRRRISKLKGISRQIRSGEMPLSSYTLIHKNARLSAAEKRVLIDWMQKTVDSLASGN